MKRKALALILGLSMLASGFQTVFAGGNDDFAVGESVNFNTLPKRMEQGVLNIAPKPEVGFFSLNGYQENIGALVVVLAFSDTADSAYTGLGDRIDELLNGETGSMKKLFADASGNKVTYHAQIPQLDNAGNLTVVKDAQPRAYYERYMQYLNPVGFQYETDGRSDSYEGRRRLYKLLTTAINNLPKESLNPEILDGNGDGEVDNVITLFPDPTGKWVDLLWPMSTYLSNDEPYPLLTDSLGETTLGVNQITFQNYSVALNTLYHETCHSLGLHDVYNYTDQTKDLGTAWTPMSSGIPYGMNSIERESLGWLIPEIIVPTAEAREYTLKALAKAGGNAYKIETAYGQSIYLEYRKKDDNLEQTLPDSGLLAWRCDETLMNANGNAYGPPYYQYLYRPLDDESASQSTANSAFSQNSGRTAMGNGTSMPLYIPKYGQYEVTEANPPQPGEVVFDTTGGKSVVFRLDSVYDSGICIYDIEEVENDELKFKIKLGKPDTLVSDPVFDNLPGNYAEEIFLSLSSPDQDEIRYTTDGTVPTNSSPLYSAPISISGAVTVKAACFRGDVSSNIVEGKYYCYTSDNPGSLPRYDGSGSNRFVLSVPYDVVHIRFEDLKDSTVSGTIVVYDAATGDGGRFEAADLFGKAVRLPTNGTVIILAESTNAKFKINGYSGVNEPVSKGATSLKTQGDGTVRISTVLRNNTKVPQNAKTIIALYDDSNKLVQAKAINEVLYNSIYSYLTGADFEFVGTEKSCRIYVWNDMENLTPLMYEF